MLKLHQTCPACPEQYDVYSEGRQIGYLRLRHGMFRADYPNCGGKTVYTAETMGDGSFIVNERGLHLGAACKELIMEFNRTASEPIHNDGYEIVMEVPVA